PRASGAMWTVIGFVAAKVVRSHSLTHDPPRRCSPTFAYVRRNGYTFSYSDCRHSAENNLRGCVALSQRLSLYIRIIKSKRQHTVTPSQPSPSAAKSLLVFNLL